GQGYTLTPFGHAPAPAGLYTEVRYRLAPYRASTSPKGWPDLSPHRRCVVGRTTSFLSAVSGYGRAPVGGQGKRCPPYRPERPAGRPAQSEPDPRPRPDSQGGDVPAAASPFTEAISVASACALTTLQMPSAARSRLALPSPEVEIQGRSALSRPPDGGTWDVSILRNLPRTGLSALRAEEVECIQGAALGDFLHRHMTDAGVDLDLRRRQIAAPQLHLLRGDPAVPVAPHQQGRHADARHPLGRVAAQAVHAHQQAEDLHHGAPVARPPSQLVVAIDDARLDAAAITIDFPHPLGDQCARHPQRHGPGGARQAG